ncbi:TPA: ABC transporter [Candidatus Sumerlaeota bacterium]|jgi:zinc transport system ATP-binding protein|nr:ABC transporter [Candidatus Sumerlaeota bacterium]
MLSPAVIFENLSVQIGGVPILDSINATVPRGSSTAIIGPNGAGKTTLLSAMLGQTSFSGHVVLLPMPDGRAPRIGYVPQRLQFDRAQPLTVLEFLTMDQQTLPLWFGTKKKMRDEALALLATVEAEHLEQRRLGALSGGEFQRVLLALALGRQPDILVLDEPVTGVDVVAERLLCDLLESLRAQNGFTQVMVTHDLSVVTAHATHVICLNRTVRGEGVPTDVLSPTVLEATFGVHRGLPDVHGLPVASGGHAPGCHCKTEEKN